MGYWVNGICLVWQTMDRAISTMRTQRHQTFYDQGVKGLSEVEEYCQPATRFITALIMEYPGLNPSNVWSCL